MKLMSFNYRGLASPHKISALKRVVGLEHPDIFLLQKTIKGGLRVRWNERTVKALNLWGMELVIGLKFLALDLEVSFTIFNIYGLYLNRIPYWVPYLTILNNAEI